MCKLKPACQYFKRYFTADCYSICIKAYIPILDEEFEEILRYDHAAPDLNKLEKDAEDEKLRLTKARKKANEINDLKALEILKKIDDENMEHEIEDALEWPGLLARAEESINDTRNIKEKYGNGRHHKS